MPPASTCRPSYTPPSKIGKYSQTKWPRTQRPLHTLSPLPPHTLALVMHQKQEWEVSSRGSSSVAAPRSYLLCHLGLLTHAAQMKVRLLSVPGESNTIADFLSRSFHLSDDAVLQHLSTHFPTQPSLQWLHLGPADVSRMTSALLQQMLPLESLQVVPPAPPLRGWALKGISSLQLPETWVRNRIK